jgi:hypothetical protein
VLAFCLLGAATFGFLALLLWRLTIRTKSEAQQTTDALEEVSQALGGVVREVTRADLHLHRLKQFRVRRILTTRLLSRLLARRRT